MKTIELLTIHVRKKVDGKGWKRAIGIDIKYCKDCEKYFDEIAELLEDINQPLKHYHDDDKKVGGKNGRKKV